MQQPPTKSTQKRFLLMFGRPKYQQIIQLRKNPDIKAVYYHQCQYKFEQGELEQRNQLILTTIKDLYNQFYILGEPKIFGIDYSAENNVETLIISQQSADYFKQMLIESSERVFTHYYDPDNGVVIPVLYNEQEAFYKRGLSQEKIQKYLYMEKIGLGVKILWYSFEQEVIIMEAGLVLSQFVFSRMNVEAVVPHLLIQINRIQILLKKLKIAHCDIKPENMIVTYSHEQGIQVKLIDMDYAVSFGEMRVIGTRRLNVLDHIDDFGNYATSVTDDYGFIYVKNFLYAQYMFPFLR